MLLRALWRARALMARLILACPLQISAAFEVGIMRSALLYCSTNPATTSSHVTCTARVTGTNPTGTITWGTSSGTGSFSASSTPLVSGSCSVTYTDTSSGVVTITASYGGDSNNAPSNGKATLTVFSRSLPSYISVESEYTGALARAIY